MKKVIVLHKKEGETPLEALEKFRHKNTKNKKEYADVPMTYAGRLDPMASGVLLILAGEETKNKEKYLALSKEYEFQILFGFATDTYDILGKVTNPLVRVNMRINELQKEINENIKYFTGTFTQAYPAYSSKTVKGKPLFQYAREAEKVELPTREVFVKSLKFSKIKKISSEKLLKNITKRINTVKGDFRQKEILKIWQKKLDGDTQYYFVADFKIACGSGTYVRTIANGLGERMAIPTLAFSIKRTKLGKYK